MYIYIALLRGINVGAQKSIKMEALRQLLATHGWQNVRTYIQSGNLIFESLEPNPQQLAEQLAQLIAAQFGFEVPTLVIALPEWQRIIADNPFLPDTADTAYLHCTFLAAAPDPDRVAAFATAAYAPDELQIIDRTVYLRCPNGYGNTKLHNSFLENKLKQTATTRNWRTVCTLAEMATTAL